MARRAVWWVQLVRGGGGGGDSRGMPERGKKGWGQTGEKKSALKNLSTPTGDRTLEQKETGSGQHLKKKPEKKNKVLVQLDWGHGPDQKVEEQGWRQKSRKKKVSRAGEGGGRGWR